MQAFIEAQSKTNHRFESLIAQVVEENKEMKSQFSKLTNVLSVQEPGKLPSQAQPNPRGQNMAQDGPEPSNIKGLNVITTRSGKEINVQDTSNSTGDSIDTSVDSPQE